MKMTTTEEKQIALIRKATQELKEANDLADWKAEQREKLNQGLKAYPAKDFRTPFCPDAPTMKYLLSKAK